VQVDSLVRLKEMSAGKAVGGGATATSPGGSGGKMNLMVFLAKTAQAHDASLLTVGPADLPSLQAARHADPAQARLDLDTLREGVAVLRQQRRALVRGAVHSSMRG